MHTQEMENVLNNAFVVIILLHTLCLPGLAIRRRKEGQTSGQQCRCLNAPNQLPFRERHKQPSQQLYRPRCFARCASNERVMISVANNEYSDKLFESPM
jgi:hypothetical protein